MTAALRLLFGRSHSIGSLIVRVGTASVWGHVGVLTDDGTVIEARAWQGVVERPFDEVVAGMSYHHIAPVECPRPEAGIAWARTQIGRPYDWAGVFAIPVRRQWDREDRWFCSEFVEAAIANAGRRRWRHPWRITPGLSYMAV